MRVYILLWIVSSFGIWYSAAAPTTSKDEKISSYNGTSPDSVQPVTQQVQPSLNRTSTSMPKNDVKEAVNQTSSSTTTSTAIPTRTPTTEAQSTSPSPSPKKEELTPGKDTAEQDDNAESDNNIEEKKPKDTERNLTTNKKPQVQNLDLPNSPHESNFLSFILIGMLLVVCIYLLQHNKKKLLGLMFEGYQPRSQSRRTNVRYQRLSQTDDA